MPSSRHWMFQPEFAWVGAYSLPIAGSHWVVVCCTESTCALDPMVKHFHGIWKQWETLSQSLLFQIASAQQARLQFHFTAKTWRLPSTHVLGFTVPGESTVLLGVLLRKGQNLEAYPYSLTIPLQQLILFSLPGLVPAKPNLRHLPFFCTE